MDSTKKLAVAFILSRLDYCNAVLADIPDEKIAKLQRIQNSAARLVLHKSKRDSTTALLRTLHWLPVNARIKYKVATLCHQCIHNVPYRTDHTIRSAMIPALRGLISISSSPFCPADLRHESLFRTRP
jgi:hypothetical protein